MGSANIQRMHVPSYWPLEYVQSTLRFNLSDDQDFVHSLQNFVSKDKERKVTAHSS